MKCSLLISALAIGIASSAVASTDLLLISIDTLRADRLSSYGYALETSPVIDAEAAAGIRFAQARTPEPLTAPAMISVLTGLLPSRHGATRNGLRMRSDLDSLPKRLRAAGWNTVGMIANWTLRDELSGLGEHFETYHEILNRKRWLGLISAEADAVDLTDQAIEALEESTDLRPLFLWVHYVEPHAPYVFQEDFADALGYDASRSTDKQACYDTEIAFVDHQIARLLEAWRGEQRRESSIVTILADHGESFGEHGYSGHGRHTYDATLHVPWILNWPGHLEPGVVETPVNLLDLVPTLASLIGVDAPADIDGADLAAALREGVAPAPRSSCFQAHKGAVQVRRNSSRARSRGLLEVAVLEGRTKEVLSFKSGDRRRFDLAADPHEHRNLVAVSSKTSASLDACKELILRQLSANDELPMNHLDDEADEHLRSLGYLD